MSTVEESFREILYQRPRLPLDLGQAILPIDKPIGKSSFGVIRVLRAILGVRKIGHAGTLDPMATGLLICLIGRATKQVNLFMDMPKTYTGVLRLGQTTASYDAETEVLEEREWRHVSEEQIEAARQALTGDIVQFPPMYSAVKVGGKRLYELARKGKEVERKERPVTVTSFELLDRDGPDISFKVHCSKGTYIRTLAHDLGQLLGTGAHLVALRRTAIGDLSVDDAWTLDALRDEVNRGEKDE